MADTMKLIPIDPAGNLDAETSLPPVSAEPALGVVEATVALYVRRGFVEPWVGYLALEAEEWVGGCGFAAPPVAGEVEIAYFTFPGHEGRGVATQMATALLDLTAEAAAQGGFEFIAHTLPEENASTSILKKLGFVHEGVIDHPEDGPVSKWRRRTPCETLEVVGLRKSLKDS